MEQFNALQQHNPKLANTLTLLSNFTRLEFKKDITLTSVFRTQAEHDALYANTPEDKRPKSSPHMFWKAADIRSKDFSDAEIKRMLTFLNCFTYTSGQGKPVALYHTIAGNTFHFHIQCD